MCAFDPQTENLNIPYSRKLKAYLTVTATGKWAIKDFDLSLFWWCFNPAPPERLRPIGPPSYSIFSLFTYRFTSLHAISITGIKIVSRIHPQNSAPLVLLPPLTPNTTYRLSARRAGLWDYGTLHPKTHKAAVLKNVPARRPSISESQGLINGCGACLHWWTLCGASQEKKVKMKVCYDIGLEVQVVGSPLSCCRLRAAVHRWAAPRRI